MNHFRFISLLLIIISLGIAAQAQEKKLVRKGNALYEQKKYKEATAAYQQAVQQNPTYVPGSFNLGNALIQQGQMDAARKVMSATAKNAKEKNEQSGAHYNIGNTYMAEQKWQDAIDNYKDALRKNPNDVDAKYNLSYAYNKLKQQNQNDKNKNQDKKNQDKKDDKKQDKDKNKDGKDKDKKDKGDQDKKDDKGDKDPSNNSQDKGDKGDQQHPQPQPSKLTEQQAENLLKALQQDEKKLQDKKMQQSGTPMKQEKDW